MKRWIAVFTLIGISAAAFGQDSFEEWQKQQDAEFNEFLAEEDRQFAEFLESEWEQFQAFKANQWDPEPKPRSAPSVTPGYTKESTEQAGKYYEKQINLPATTAGGGTAGDFSDTYMRNRRNTIGIPFYEDVKLYVSDPGLPDIAVQTPVSNQKISSAYRSLSEWDYQALLKELKEIRSSAKLNDWGYYKLVAGTAAALFPRNAAAADMVTWFLLVKSEFDVRLGYSADGRNVYLLLPAMNMIYDVLYFYFNESGPYYYFFTAGEPAKNVGAFYTYTADNPDGDVSVDMKIMEVPRFRDDLAKRTLHFMYRGEPYSIEVNIDQNLVSFGSGYPQTDLDVYFSTPVSVNTRHTLIGSLQLLVEGRSETEAVNLLLRFVQTAFDYKTDQEQFGIEKPMFIEETLFYPYCDCEDRSILFSYLVEEIMNLEVIALDYPGHIATAVRFSKPVSGDSVSYNGIRYVICDPTYINADIGMAMPRYKSLRPSIIEYSR